ncbi:FecR family protein [Chitinophaga sp.]|uniref:FecR family protein n=1 Tax=Chitinophaga sp. TaxID=1869181 RepID=UPI002F927F52
MKISRKRIAQYLNPLPDREQEKKEWDSFDHSIDKDPAFWQHSWNVIQQQRKRQVLIRRMKQIAVAAALSGVMLGSYYWFRHTPSPTAVPVIAAAQLKTITNATAEAMDLLLDDSTTVTLFPASSLHYAAAFPGAVRNVYLEGTALFNVQHDAAKPFTVFNNGIATTVLGTTFKVTAAAGDHKTSIYLYKGKVVIRSADSLQAKLRQDYYLLPGDVFSYDRNNGLAVLTNSRPPASRPPEHSNNATVSNWYMFENQELPQVLDQLSAIYNVPVHYNPADLKGINFIGKIDRTDSLENVLKDIALLNHLIVVNNGKNYSLKKQ